MKETAKEYMCIPHGHGQSFVRAKEGGGRGEWRWANGGRRTPVIMSTLIFN